MFLAGIRILAVEQYGAGPFGTQYLSEMGAEVIKIENPRDGGDVSRNVGPHFVDALPETAQSVFYQGLNRGKKSLTLDLSVPAGRAVFGRLAASAHAVASNLRGDVPERLGLTYRQMSAVNPAIVCAHLTGYGRTGERAKWPGYDYLMQAEAGYFSLTGEPDTPPTRMGLSMIDYMTGALMSLGLTSALVRAMRTGVGGDVDVSLFDVAVHNLNYVGNWFLASGEQTGRAPRSAHPSLTPCQSYKTRDGWIYLMCNKEKFWATLCRRIGREAWIDDPRFVAFPQRLQHRAMLTTLLDETLSTRTTAEWLKVFAGSVPASPILSVGEALSTPYVTAGNGIEECALPDGAALRLLRGPIRTDEPGAALPLAPRLGEHTTALLEEAGFSAEECAALRADGVI